ncbi:MAG: hypothetical protein AB2A00_30990 [Myxococcota bacterium]
MSSFMASSQVGNPVRRRLGLLAPLALAVLATPSDTQAFNPLTSLAEFNRIVGSGVSALGRHTLASAGNVLGNMVDALATPVLEGAELRGWRLLDDVEDRVSRQVDHAREAARDVTNTAAEQALRVAGNVNQDMAARILQAQVAANDVAQRTLGRLDDVARARIKQAGAEARNLVEKVSAETKKRLDDLDRILEVRAGQLEGIVSRSILQADAAVAARIDQADEAVGKRIGNVDVVITKQGLAAEGSILRVATLIAMVVLLAFVIWRLWVEFVEAWRRMGDHKGVARMGHTLKDAALRMVVQLLLAGAGAAGLYVLSDGLSVGPRKERDALAAHHDQALKNAVAALDFTRVKYHAAQLQLLDATPEDEKRHVALVMKSELLRTVLMRGASFRTLDGLRDLMKTVSDVEHALGQPDADVESVKAHVLWRVGATREAEYEAACHAARALELGKGAAPEGFLLRPLAEHYVRLFKDDPSLPEFRGNDTCAATLQVAAVPSLDQVKPYPPLQHLFVFDHAVRKLQRTSNAAYVALLEQHVAYRLAGGRARLAPGTATMDALVEREKQAKAVVAAWREFDMTLESNPWLLGTPLVLAVFQLNDAMLSHALWFLDNRDTDKLPPRLAEAETAGAKATMAPVRMAWLQRYAPALGRRLQDVVSYQESERFLEYEQQLLVLERSVEAFRTGLSSEGMGVMQHAWRAAEAAAALGLYAERNGRPVRYADVLAANFPDGWSVPDTVKSRIQDAYRLRPL